MLVERVVRFQPVSFMLDVEDRRARERGVRGPNPRPLDRLDFHVVGRIVGGVREDFPRPWRLVLKRNSDGYFLFFGLVKGVDDQVRRDVLAPGTYVLRVSSPSRLYQTAERTDIVISAPEDVEANRLYLFELEPGHAYPFSGEAPLAGGRGPTLLRGGLRHVDGRGIVNAVVEVPGVSNRSRTDDGGNWLLTFPESQPDAAVTVRVTLADGTVEDIASVNIVHGTENILRQTALRGWVLTNTGAGIVDARVRVEGRTGEATSGEDGGWFYYLGLNQTAAMVTVAAVHPDGRVLMRSGVQVQPRSTVIVPPVRFS